MNEIDIIEDVKILSDENDMYGAKEKALSIVEFIELEANRKLLSKNNLIAIYGRWGTGKSSLLKTVEQNLDKKKFKTIWFDTWKNEKDDNLPYSLFKFIIKDKIGEIVLEKGKSFLKGAYGIFKCLSSGIHFNVSLPPTENGTAEIEFNPDDIFNTAEEQIQKIDENEDLKCLWEKIDDFEKDFSKITFGEKRLVVFLDDLDRCESENIIALLSSIKLLLSCNPNIIFVMGIDKEAVTLALQNKYHNNFNKADEYLEKLFPINFTMPNKVKERKTVEYISSVTALSIEDSQKIFDFLMKIKFNNPRHLKKVFRKYYIIKLNLWNRGIDIENVYMIIFILYMIILNNFYENEYNCLVNKDKSKLYKNVLLKSSKDGISILYNSREKVMMCKYKKNEIDILALVEKISPYKLEKSVLDVRGYVGSPILINVSNWLLLFEDNICINFIEFILENIEMLEIFIDLNGDKTKCSKLKIEEYIKKIDGLM